MINYSRWLATSLSTRQKIADDFKIIKKGSTHVVDNKVTSDGYIVEEIEAALSIEAMHAYLGIGSSNLDANTLFVMIVDKIEHPQGATLTATPPPAPLPPPSMSVLPKAEAKQFKREYKKRKNATKNKKQK